MNKREVRVLKSPHLREGSTFFQITVKIIYEKRNILIFLIFYLRMMVFEILMKMN